MRSLIFASCCGVVAIILQGCGGGGGTTCLAEKPTLASQSFAGVVTGTTTMHIDGKTQDIPLKSQITEKMDFEQFNFRMDSEADVTMEKMTAKAVVRQIVLASQQKVVMYQKMTVNGSTITSNCTVTDVPQIAQLPLLLKSIVKPAIQKAAKCDGNDGTYDTWAVDKDMPETPIPQIPNVPPMPDGTTAKGSIHEKLQMTKDGLLHSSTTKVTFEAYDKDHTSLGAGEGNVDVKITNSQAGGPTAEDLDYSAWGCKPSDEKMDLEEIFKGAQSPLKQHIASTLFAAQKEPAPMPKDAKSVDMKSVVV